MKNSKTGLQLGLSAISLSTSRQPLSRRQPDKPTDDKSTTIQHLRHILLMNKTVVVKGEHSIKLFGAEKDEIQMLFAPAILNEISSKELFIFGHSTEQLF